MIEKIKDLIKLYFKALEQSPRALKYVLEKNEEKLKEYEKEKKEKESL